MPYFGVGVNRREPMGFASSARRLDSLTTHPKALVDHLRGGATAVQSAVQI